MTLPDPTPEEMIISLGISAVPDIDQALLDACMQALDTKESPQDFQTAFNCLRAVLMRHWDNPNPEVQKHVAEALQRRAQILSLFKRVDEARADYEEIWMRYEDSDDPDVRNSVAVALYEAGKLEQRERNPQTAEKWYSLIERYVDSSNSNVQYMIANAQDNLGELLAEAGELKQALAVFDRAIGRWTQHHDYWVRRSVSNIRHSKATALMDDGEYETALYLFDETTAYADRLIDPPGFFPQIAARLSKCYCLERMKRYSEAIDAVEDLERWVDKTARPNPYYRGEDRETTEGLFRRAMMTKARCLHRLGDYQSALEACDQTGRAVVDIESCTEQALGIVEDLMWRATILADLGQVGDAHELLYSVLHRLKEFGAPTDCTRDILGVIAHVGKYIGIEGFQEYHHPS